jgi:hypothetical protein
VSTHVTHVQYSTHQKAAGAEEKEAEAEEEEEEEEE